MLLRTSLSFARKSQRQPDSMVGLVAAVMLVTSSIMNLYCHAFAATTIYGNKLFQSQQQQFIIVSSISSTRSNEIAIDNKNQNRNNINNLILNPMLAEDVIAAATMDTNDVAVSVGTTSTSTTTATISSSRDDDDDDSLFSSYLIPNPGGNTFSSMRLWQGRALAILAAAIFGTNFSLVKFLDSAGSDIPIAAAAVLRFTLASIVVSTVVEISDNKNRNNNNMYHHLDWGMTNSHDLEKRHAFLSGGEVGLWYGAGYIAQAVGLHTVDASKSAFFAAMAVLFVPILDASFRGRPLTPNTIGSVVLALSGVALLQNNAASFSAGDFTSLLQAVFFGIGYFRLEAVSQRYPTSTARVLSGELWGTTLMAILYMMIMDGIGSNGSNIFMGFPAMLVNISSWLTDPSTAFAILWTGLISTSLALYLETSALTVLPASEVTILMTTISLWGSAFAYLLFGEVLGISGWMGGFLILVGCLLNTIKSEENFDNGLENETTATSIPLKMD